MSLHFSARELRCRCTFKDCTYTLVDDALIAGLEELRGILGPLIINDAYRCKKQNDLVGGKPGSQHLLGKAADIRGKKSSADDIAETAETVVACFKNGGVGRYDTFTHVDVRAGRSRWNYSKGSSQVPSSSGL